jgi:hypothetical protein
MDEEKQGKVQVQMQIKATYCNGHFQLWHWQIMEIVSLLMT